MVTGVSIRQQVIVRFKSWKLRTEVYRNRKKSKSLRYKVDLTKRRVNPLAKARQSTKHMDGIDYVLADINCRLKMLNLMTESSGFSIPKPNWPTLFLV